ncbi:ceramidase domain-containing protein [Methylobacterium sp. J-078]|uniref:ceramidase domain-containing protein n=1 Tax=Methylobacterium sp. J-078 TaxID=2836657 RepID=UPI001FBA9AFB|nr:ceramidase domain-containing protein [Methylobacterium sp. J-078]MCJ2047531.1 ceramidase domain-containing protein [Methylobacterium sp. J-078]
MTGDWTAPICAYCERGDPGFWAEPVNALSNGAFLVAAALAAWRVRRAGTVDAPAFLLSALVAVVGVGSFLFHTLAVRWSLLADVIPIALFIYAYFLLAMRRYFGLGLVAALAATLAFAAINIGLEPALDAATGRSMDALTNGSIGYAPAILALAGVAAGLLVPQGCRLGPARREAGRALLGVALLFAVSLAFRTLDRAICPVWPLGTHALWHLLNAGVLYALIAIAARYRERRS